MDYLYVDTSEGVQAALFPPKKWIVNLVVLTMESVFMVLLPSSLYNTHEKWGSVL